MINGSVNYRSAAAFRRAVTDKLKWQAAVDGKPFALLQRQWVMRRFLALLFTRAPEAWMLKGGTGLMMRLPNARASRDIDLAARADPQRALDELVAATWPDPGDFLTFNLRRRPDKSHAARFGVEALIGATVFEEFTIDVPLHPHDGEVVLLQPSPVIEVEGLAELPLIAMVPLAVQVADKVCALYEEHEGRPSSRYRDLIDLQLIMLQEPPDLGELRRELEREAARRHLVLPVCVRSPDPIWSEAYPQQARAAGQPGVEPDLEDALRVVGRWLDPVLADVAR